MMLWMNVKWYKNVYHERLLSYKNKLNSVSLLEVIQVFKEYLLTYTFIQQAVQWNVNHSYLWVVELQAIKITFLLCFPEFSMF